MQVNDNTQLYDEQTESYFLHCLINEPEIVQDELQGITEELFINPLNQMVYNVCTVLLENNQLNSYNVLQKAREAHKCDLTDFMLEVEYSPSRVTNVAEYGLKLKNMGILRNILQKCETFHQKAQDAPLNDIVSVIDEIQESFDQDVSTLSTSEEFNFNEVMKDAVQKLQGIQRKDPEYYGISTGLFALDQLILGLKQNELIILGARPSIGKTALAINTIGLNVAKAGHHVHISSLEMPAADLIIRMIQSETGLNVKNLPTMSSGELQSILQRGMGIKELPICIDEDYDWDQIQRNIKKSVKKYGTKLAIIDYIGLVQIKGDYFSREQQVAAISRKAKKLAKDLGIRIMMLSQLNRGAENKAPQMHELRESGAIEQDADVVMFIHRDRPSDNEEVQKMINQGIPVPCQILVPKNRNGETGYINAEFTAHKTLFHDPIRQEGHFNGSTF